MRRLTGQLNKRKMHSLRACEAMRLSKAGFFLLVPFGCPADAPDKAATSAGGISSECIAESVIGDCSRRLRKWANNYRETTLNSHWMNASRGTAPLFMAFSVSHELARAHLSSLAE